MDDFHPACSAIHCTGSLIAGFPRAELRHRRSVEHCRDWADKAGPFPLDCLQELWEMMGCLPAAPYAPRHAPEKQLAYWHGVSLDTVYADMQLYRKYSRLGREPHATLCQATAPAAAAAADQTAPADKTRRSLVEWEMAWAGSVAGALSTRTTDLGAVVKTIAAVAGRAWTGVRLRGMLTEGVLDSLSSAARARADAALLPQAQLLANQNNFDAT